MVSDAGVITVFADASYYDGAGGYAYWGRTGGADRVFGSAPWPCSGIDEVETVALAVGIMESIAGLPFSGGAIVAQSDSLAALGAFLWGAGKLGFARSPVGVAKNTDRPINAARIVSPTQEAFVLRCISACWYVNGTVWLKHVKGHSGKEDPRSKVNEWCDQHAKQARRLCAQQVAAPSREYITTANL